MNERPVGAGCAKALTRQAYQPAPRPPKGVTPWPTQLRPRGIPMLHSLPGVSQRDPDRLATTALFPYKRPGSRSFSSNYRGRRETASRFRTSPRL